MHHDTPSHPPTDKAPGKIGKWEMLDVNFINSATHVALLPTDKIFIYGGRTSSRTHPCPAPKCWI